MILDKYPKTQSVLPPAYQAIYVEHYKSNRDRDSAATSISGKLEEWMHRKVASSQSKFKNQNILELGAGTLNHVRFEKDYQQYDIVEPFKELFEHSPTLKKIDTVYNDLFDVPMNNQYDRIISIAVLEHLCELPKLVAQSCLLLKPGGVFAAGIPSEGEFLWKLAYTVTTGIEFKKKYGLDYAVMMNHEHVNTAKDIGEVLTYFFRKAKRSLFGLNTSLSLYQSWECSDPDIEKAQAYLNQISK